MRTTTTAENRQRTIDSHTADYRQSQLLTTGSERCTLPTGTLPLYRPHLLTTERHYVQRTAHQPPSTPLDSRKAQCCPPTATPAAYQQAHHCLQTGTPLSTDSHTTAHQHLPCGLPTVTSQTTDRYTYWLPTATPLTTKSHTTNSRQPHLLATNTGYQQPRHNYCTDSYTADYRQSHLLPINTHTADYRPLFLPPLPIPSPHPIADYRLFS